MTIKFPTNVINPSYPLDEEYEDTSITSKFEDGSMQSRRKFTRSRKKFSLKWESLTQEEFVIIRDFIINEAHFAANIFEWTNPVDNKVYYVRCTSFKKANLREINFWSVDLEFTEV